MSAVNYAKIRQEIDAIALRCRRNPREITLVAVSKGHDWNAMLPAFQAGCRDFGESRIQDALEKMPNAPKDVRWHMIGTLQANKVRKAIGKFALIHSVDTTELTKKISDCSLEAGVKTSILLQANTSGEQSKHGLSPTEWKKNFESLLTLPGIHIEGLMTIAPLVDDENEIRRCFSALRSLRDELAAKAGDKASMHHLSMGMSHDFHLAIAEGATIVRIGRALFSS